LNENYSYDIELENVSRDSKTTQKATQKTTQKTTQKILNAMKEKTDVTTSELSEICGITVDGVKWQLRNLTKIGRISRVGGDRGGHWEVSAEVTLD
jgi:ATP-dependent DNA helicase RecG